MNFIGHAAVALWYAARHTSARATPDYVLGSMLPDFAGMAGIRLASPPASAPEELRAGVALHHRTDEVFHAASEFVALQQHTLDTLTARGVPRGTARAVGHIGVEMLIDGELLTDPTLADTYTRALAAEIAVGDVFPEQAHAARYAHLHARLTAHGVPYDYRDPDAVLRRLQYTLASRPRLAIGVEVAPEVRRLLPSLQHEVRAALPALLATVRAGLS